MPEQVKVRFAPSPTGFLHLGSARTALFNWLYARHTGGKLILRIEDTDRERSKKEFLDEILMDMKWLGLDWDDGPYFQSERTPVYKETAEKLVEKGLAYREGNAIIFKVEGGKEITIDDMVHGTIKFNTDEIKDQVLIKSDGSPAYNFACVVDDDQMGITHILRGDDHISNTPKQILFYEALGFKQPKFAHMPLMMGKDGAKLSKRHGGVAVFEYKEEGFLPQALVNYLMLLGWLPKDGREIFTIHEAAKEFDIKDINPVQVRFDIDKLKWINGEYIRTRPAEEFAGALKERIAKSGVPAESVDDAYLLRIIKLYSTRFKTLSEFVASTECFFKDDYRVDEADHKKTLGSAEAKKPLADFIPALEALGEFTAPKIEEACRKLAEEKGIKAAKIIHPTRVAISGTSAGAGLFEMMEVLGKEKVLTRVKKAVI
jgi:glutamyl-tRNA synthetase